MKTKTILLIATVAWAWAGAAGFGQGSTSTNASSTTSTGAVFRVRLAATCQAFDSTRGRIVTTSLTDRDIVAQALGTSPANQTVTRDFELAYNAAEDSLQVVNTNTLQPVVDVVHFGGGAATADHRQLVRFTLLFFPGQTNELGAETNVFGSAVITERTNQVGRTGTPVTPNITGRLQFILTGGNVLGMTNPVAVGVTTNGVGATNLVTGTTGTGTAGMTKGSSGSMALQTSSSFVMANSNIVFDTTAKICVGTFTTARAVPTLKVPTPPLVSTTNGVIISTNLSGVITTNGVPATTITNTTPSMTNAAASTVIGFNPITGTVSTNSGTANIGAGSVAGTPGTAGISGTTGIGMTGVTTTPGVVGATGLGTTVGATSTGSGAIATGTPTGSGTITTGTGTVGTGTTGAVGTTGTTGTPITTGF